MNLSRTGDLALLCLLSGSGWLLEHFYPRSVPFPVSGFIHFLLIGVIATAVWSAAGNPKTPGAKAGGIAFSGTILFALPAVMLGISSVVVSEFTSLALYCSIPLMTALLLEAFNWPGLRGAGPRSLSISVLGLGGALLLFPVQLPGEMRGWACVVLIAGCCALAAFAGIELHRTIQDVPLAATVALVSFGSAALLAACGTTKAWAAVSLHTLFIECLRCLVFNLPVTWLTVWLIREMEPGRFSARFLIVPLVTAVEGFAATGGASLQAVIGMALMGACGVMLAVDPSHDEGQAPSSLHLR